MISHIQANEYPDSLPSSGGEEEISSSGEEEEEQDRDADEEEDDEEDDKEVASQSQAKKVIKAKGADVNPFAILGEVECCVLDAF